VKPVARSAFGRVERQDEAVAWFSDGKGPLMAMSADGQVRPVERNDDGQGTGS
jgi:hypothetical protein